MSWNFFDFLDVAVDVLELLGSKPSEDNPTNHYKLKKRNKYFTEMVSAGMILVSAILLIWVFKNPLPAGNNELAFIVASLIGTAISFLLFFVLHVLELYYFKNVFKLLFFSGSVIAFFISAILFVYFRSGIFVYI